MKILIYKEIGKDHSGYYTRDILNNRQGAKYTHSFHLPNTDIRPIGYRSEVGGLKQLLG